MCYLHLPVALVAHGKALRHRRTRRRAGVLELLVDGKVPGTMEHEVLVAYELSLRICGAFDLRASTT